MSAPVVDLPAPELPSAHGSVRRRLPALGVGLGGAAILGIAAFWSTSSVTSGPGTCIFRLLAGLPCPGCGLTRSFVMFAHGDVPSAFGYNLMGPVLFSVLVISVIVAAWVLITGRAQTLSRWGSIVFSKAALVIVAIWLGYGVTRMVSAGADLGWFPTIT